MRKGGERCKTIAASFGVDRQTIYRYLKAYRSELKWRQKKPSWLESKRGSDRLHMAELILDLDDLIVQHLIAPPATLETFKRVRGLSVSEHARRAFVRVRHYLAEVGIPCSVEMIDGDNSSRIVVDWLRLKGFVNRERPIAFRILEDFKGRTGRTTRFRGRAE